MLPTSVLRMWFLGIIGWAILGVGVYLIWEASRSREPIVNRPVVLQVPTGEPNVRELPGEERTRPLVLDEPNSSRRRNAGYLLAAGLACITLSFAPGGLPLFLSLFRGSSAVSQPPAIEERTIARPDGSRLHVEINGPADGPTLVLTHGWSLNHNEWQYVRNELGGRFRIVTWDLPGLGKSQSASDHDQSIAKMASDLDAVVAETKNGPVILVGHSIGGMIIQTYCRLFPERLQNDVAGLCLVNTTYTNPLKTATAAQLLKILEKPLIVPLNYLTIVAAPLVWLSNWQSYFNGSLQLTTRFTSFAGTQSWRQVDQAARLSAKAWPAVVARGNFAMLEFDEQATLPQVTVPTLVVSGRNDRLTKPHASERILALTPEGLGTTLHPAGHLGLWERHSEFAEVLTEFTEKYLSGPKRTTTHAMQPLHHTSN